jgi:uncharacterized protein YbjT (DUF2867 family)
MSTLLIAGATGLVGRQVLNLALADNRWAKIVAPTRRALAGSTDAGSDSGLDQALANGRLVNPVVDFAALPSSLFDGVDAVACALGTTMKVAGSKEKFKAIDHGLVVALATAAKAAGVGRFGYVSSVGAKLDGASFYLRVKAEIERDLSALGFGSLLILRPSFLGGDRPESRPMERIGLGLFAALKPLIPKRYRVVDAERVAKALLDGLAEGRPGVAVLESEQIQLA